MRWKTKSGTFEVIRTLLVLLALLSTATTAAARTAEDVVHAFFGPAGIADTDAYYTGEMLAFRDQPTLGQSLPAGVTTSMRTIGSSAEEIVIGVTLAHEGRTQDWYAFLENEDDEWKLAAVRTLATSAIESALLEQLGAKTARTAEEDWEFENLQLLFESDAGLADFVKVHRAELDEIVQVIAEDPEAAAEAAKRLHVERVDRTSRGTVVLTIGGTLDNTVGFLWVPEVTSPPSISPSRYILVENVVGGWYIFKTT